MRKNSMMMLTLIILAALLIPAIPKASAALYQLSGTWNSTLYVWLGGTPPPVVSGYQLAFIGTAWGTWSGTESSGTISGSYSGGVYTSSGGPIGGAFGTLSGTYSTWSWNPSTGQMLATASGSFSGDLTGSWEADIDFTISTNSGTMRFRGGGWVGIPVYLSGAWMEFMDGGGYIIASSIVASFIAPLAPGAVGLCSISVDDVTDLRAYEFTLSYDANVLQVIDWEPLSIFTIPAPAEIGSDYITVGALSPSTTGLTTSVPVAIARITFIVISIGWSRLDIHDSALLDVNLNIIPALEIDGGFANVDVADLKGRGVWPDVRRFSQSQLGPIDTLYARVATDRTGTPVNVKAVFTVYDELGMILGTIETGTATLPELSETILTADFNTNAFGTPPYKVFIKAQAYYDINGDGLMDGAGSRIKSTSIVVLP